MPFTRKIKKYNIFLLPIFVFLILPFYAIQTFIWVQKSWQGINLGMTLPWLLVPIGLVNSVTYVLIQKILEHKSLRWKYLSGFFLIPWITLLYYKLLLVTLVSQMDLWGYPTFPALACGFLLAWLFVVTIQNFNAFKKTTSVAIFISLLGGMPLIAFVYNEIVSKPRDKAYWHKIHERTVAHRQTFHQQMIALYGKNIVENTTAINHILIQPNSKLLTFPSHLEDFGNFRPQELTLLQELKLKGIFIGTKGIQDYGQDQRITLVMNQPLEKEVSLQQPQHTWVVYVQSGDTFKVYPENVPLREEKIFIKTTSLQESNDKSQVHIKVENPKGKVGKMISTFQHEPMLKF